MVIGCTSKRFSGGKDALQTSRAVDSGGLIVGMVSDTHHGRQCIVTCTKTEIKSMQKSSQMGVFCSTQTRTHSGATPSSAHTHAHTHTHSAAVRLAEVLAQLAMCASQWHTGVLLKL